MTTHMVNMSVRSGRHLSRVPIDMRRPVRRMEALRPLASKNQMTGTMGTMYMMLPQLPRRASVASVHCGQNTASTDSDIGPKVFHIMP